MRSIDPKTLPPFPRRSRSRATRGTFGPAPPVPAVGAVEAGGPACPCLRPLPSPSSSPHPTHHAWSCSGSPVGRSSSAGEDSFGVSAAGSAPLAPDIRSPSLGRQPTAASSFFFHCLGRIGRCSSNPACCRGCPFSLPPNLHFEGSSSSRLSLAGVPHRAVDCLPLCCLAASGTSW